MTLILSHLISMNRSLLIHGPHAITLIEHLLSAKHFSKHFETCADTLSPQSKPQGRCSCDHNLQRGYRGSESALVNLGSAMSDAHPKLTMAIAFLSHDRPAVTWTPVEALLHEAEVAHLTAVSGGLPSPSGSTLAAQCWDHERRDSINKREGLTLKEAPQKRTHGILV